MDELANAMVYVVPFLCVIFGFLLNATHTSVRAAGDRRASDVEYRTRILAHVDYVEKRLTTIDESVRESVEFRGQVNQFIDAVDGRLMRIERKLDCDTTERTQ